MTHLELTFAQAKPLIMANLNPEKVNKVGITPALIGEPGIGKTSLIMDMERDLKTKVFVLPVNQLADRADLTGVRMTQDEHKNWQQEAFPHSIIMESIQYAKDNPTETPILFLDEFNRASSDITSAILSFQTLRKIGNHEFPDNLRLILAGNDKGNVTSIDGASISRLAVYRVRPDLETFLSVQELNPFVSDVLAKYPEDLMAKESAGFVSSEDEDDDEDQEDSEFAHLESVFTTEESFSQITRPRTISYVSEWLDVLGINKSGSDKEKELLGNLFTNMTGSENVLMAGIQAHVGQTTFAYHLFEEIQAHFNGMLTAGHSSNKPLLSHIRPKQEVINSLSRSTSTQEVEQLIASLDEGELLNAVVWLTENASVKEINNNRAVTDFMSNAPHSINAFDNNAIKNLMTVFPEASRVSQAAAQAMLNSSAQSVAQWKGVLGSVLESE